MIERGNPLCMLKEKQGHSNSSLETTKQNQDCHWGPDHSLNRVNDQVRKRQKRSSMNVAENDEKTFYDMGNVHVCNIGISSIHGKNSAKADTQSSVPRVHCPEVSSKAKAVENCRSTVVPIWKRLKLFSAQLLL